MGKDKKVQYENTEVKVSSPKVMKSHDFLMDSLKRRRIRLYLYKGQPIAGRELAETDVSAKKLRLIRIKVDFMQLSDKVSIDMLAVKDNIEQVDIDFSLLELFFKRYFDKWQMARLFSPLLDVYDISPPGAKIGDITLEYGQYLELVSFLEFLLKEPLKNDKPL